MTDKQFEEMMDVLRNIESNTSSISLDMPSSTMNDIDKVVDLLKELLKELRKN